MRQERAKVCLKIINNKKRREFASGLLRLYYTKIKEEQQASYPQRKNRPHSGGFYANNYILTLPPHQKAPFF